MIDIAEATIHDITTSRLTDHQVWEDLVVVFDEIIQANVDDPIRQLEVLRLLPPDADGKILADVCRMLGFDLSQDVLNMSVDKFTKLASQIGMYPDTNGTEDFPKFVSLLTNGTCTVDYLWTCDYVNFYKDLPVGAVLLDSSGNGRWFKSTHVDLNMGFSTLSGLQLKENQTLGQKIVDIFYQQAPATLVIERQTFTVDIAIEDVAFGAQVLDTEREYQIDCVGGRLL